MKNMRLGNNRGQAFSVESIFAYLIFLIVFSSVIFLWNQSTANIMQAEHSVEVQDLGMVITENLVRTRGIPENWTDYDYLSEDSDNLGVEIIGLADESRILEEDKVIAFMDMMNSSNNNYTSHKWLLGLSKPRFQLEFYFTITDLNGTLYNMSGRLLQTGRPPSEDAIYKFPIVRTAILEDEIVKVKLVVWNPE
ncbi:MAG: hypothetical protein B6U72_02825 [Candidatus Altiarchaeales archaeon ex4484_2]|nr:MAG: hypothetical protein B6U72_02825 [Candidatus Altiarchaeales archaeon ex4484_2]